MNLLHAYPYPLIDRIRTKKHIRLNRIESMILSYLQTPPSLPSQQTKLVIDQAPTMVVVSRPRVVPRPLHAMQGLGTTVTCRLPPSPRPPRRPHAPLRPPMRLPT